MTFLNTKYIETAEVVFLNPRELYPWEEIVNGVRYGNQNEKKYAVAANTARAFHRTESYKALDKGSKNGPLALLKRYFSGNRTALVAKITSIKSRDELDKLADSIATELREILAGVVKPHLLGSYNLMRKPVDLYMEHLVCMSHELAKVRQGLVPFLYLPLDSQIFQYSRTGDDELFSEKLLKKHGLKRAAGFSWVKDRPMYLALQGEANKRATRPEHQIKKTLSSGLLRFDMG